ncbi:MAG: hypothetical protein JW855_06050 [Gammaproteobacteria bacterium]|nr:hypothetical protein [Gammaproteobacteria bacterium]
MPNKHVVIQYAGEIEKICEPLVKKTPIKTFSFCRNYRDGYTLLSEDGKWAEEYINKGYQSCIREECNWFHMCDYQLWDAANQPKISEKFERFNQDLVKLGYSKGITIYEKQPDHLIMYDFATNSDPKSTEFLLSNIDYFKNFIFYFKEKIHCNRDLTKAFYKKYSFAEEPVTKNIDLTATQKPLKVNKYYLLDDQCSFSKKEMDISRLVALGQTSKQIAKNLNNSFRTIENHLVNIKNKAQCENLSELREKLWSSDIFRMYMSIESDTFT